MGQSFAYALALTVMGNNHVA
ncbi:MULTISPECIES: membrane protein YoeI [Enterobacteriaceae]|uniref:Membrane protein YoeI n=1 Tax=Lelliottia amnigena TaxID=61646 RepID=A0AAP2F390_LELAM|nr:membrane protein YoeI [Lelliottia amnigena]MBL5922262.1 membrane protein YoeI [Lelliottia amnigena]MBL5930330.1 membrane protein YoeI [Lelliottia amnigena]MBL5936360.1 membrane protein YoeI [Lelliottia amnigena]MBL5963997.1 membrane protein YoeI [Lelliottia amnigena]